MTQIASLSRLNALQGANATPSSVTNARVVVFVHSGLLVTVGALLLVADGATALGIASIVEGAVRLGLGVGLRRGAHRVRLALLVLGVIGVFVGFMAGGVAIIGAIINLAIVSCLRNEEARQFLGS